MPKTRRQAGEAAFPVGPYRGEAPASRNQYRFEEMEVVFAEPGSLVAQVTCPSGLREPERIYHTSPTACDCPSGTNRGECRHMGVVRQIFGEPVEGMRLETARRARLTYVPPGSPVGDELRDRLLEARRRQEAQTAAQAVEDAVALGDAVAPEIVVGDPSAPVDPAAMSTPQWNQFLQTADWGEYQTRGVFSDPRMTFGVETEFLANSDQLTRIWRRMQAEGLTNQRNPLMPYHAPRDPGFFAIQRDGSVMGGELISPTMTDSPGSWRALDRALTILREEGAHTNRTTGGHVHVGRAELLRTEGGMRRLVGHFIENEGVWYRVAAGGSAGGVHRATQGSHYSEPIRYMNGYRSGTTDTDQDAQRLIYFHTAALSYSASNPTIEFRLWESSIDSREVQAHVAMSVETVLQATREARDPHAAPVAQRDPNFAPPQDANHPDREVRHMLSGLFSHNPTMARRIAYLYRVSRWQNLH